MSADLREAARCLAVLGLEPGASVHQVRSSHRALARVWHPDRFESDPALRASAEERIKEINAAYSWLLRNKRALREISPEHAARRRSRARSRGLRPSAATAATWLGVLILAAGAAWWLTPRGAPASKNAAEVDVAAAPAETPRQVRLERLSSFERSMVVSACTYERLEEESGPYYRCIDDQLAALARSPGAPAMGGANPSKRASLRVACSYARKAEGPAAFYQCLRDELRGLAGAAAPAR